MWRIRRTVSTVGHYAFSVFELILYVIFILCLSAILACLFLAVIWLSSLGVVDGPGSIPGN